MFGRFIKILPVIGIAILAYLIMRTGPLVIYNTFINAKLMFILPALVFYIAYLIVQNSKWYYLIMKQNIRIGYFDTLKIYIIGIFYGIITPGRIGNFLRINYLNKKTKRGVSECSVSIVVDKMLDFIALFILGITGIFFYVNILSLEIFIGITVLFVLLLVFFFVFMKKKTSGILLRFLWKKLMPQKYKIKTKDAFNYFYDNVMDWKQMIIPFFMTIIGWILIYSTSYMIALSIGIVIPYESFILLMPLATLVGFLPLTIGGWGTREAVLIILFSIYSITSDAIIAMSILNSIMTYLIIMVLGSFFAFSEEFRQVKE